MEKIQNSNKYTKDSSNTALDNFENFALEKYGKANLIPDLKKAKEEEIFDVLQGWINWNEDKAPGSMRVYFSHVRRYLHYMGIKLHDQDVHAELTFKHKIEEELYGLTQKDIQLILKEMRYRYKVQYLCQSSSLMRVGEMVQLRKKHLILGQDNIIVKIPATIAKYNKGRTTFFSKEASRLLVPLLKEKDDDDLVFGTCDNPKNTIAQNTANSTSAVSQVFRKAIKNAGLDKKRESTGRYTINTHAFRAFGITKLSRLDPNFAKKLAGQKGYLDQYDRMSDEEKLDLYEKYESELLIDDSEKKNAEMEKLRDANSTLTQAYEDEIKRNSQAVGYLRAELDKLKKSQSDNVPNSIDI